MGRAAASDQERLRMDDHLYEQFGEPLEGDHEGEYVAIGRHGETVVGSDDLWVLQQALERFGRGEFAFRRIGDRALGKWRRLPS